MVRGVVGNGCSNQVGHFMYVGHELVFCACFHNIICFIIEIYMLVLCYLMSYL